MRTPDQAEFEKCVAGHELIVALEQGLHRHLTFKIPGSSVYHFHLTTWPGYLAITGDMGCFVFARLPDMFEFFRPDTAERGINPSYWSEKLQGSGGRTSPDYGASEFSAELYFAAIKSDFDQWEFATPAQKKEAWAELEGDDLNQTPDSLGDAIRTAMDYKCPVTGNRFRDFYEHTLTDYTYHFIWCCRAIQWGILRYDAMKAAPKAAAGGVSS